MNRKNLCKFGVFFVVLAVSPLISADLMFEPVFPDAGIDYVGESYGLAWSDYDRDGDPDIWVVNHFAPSTLYRNDNGSFDTVFIPPTD